MAQSVDPSEVASDASVVRDDGSIRDAGVARDAGSAAGDAASDAEPPASTDAGTDADDAGPSDGDASSDAGRELPAGATAFPAPSCESDLSFVGGTLRPALGTVPEPLDESIDPEHEGAYAVLTDDVLVPVSAGMRSAAGYDITLGAALSLNGTFYAPSLDGGSTVASASFPLLVVLPGFTQSYTAYAEYARHFASHGFVVLGLDTQGSSSEALHDEEALQVSSAITWALGESPFKARLDGTKIAVAGHSKGGKVAFFAAALDARIDLVVGWDPSNGGGPPCFIDASACDRLPVAPSCEAQKKGIEQPEGVLHFMHAESLVFGVPPDAFNPEPRHNAREFYRGAPSPAALVYMTGSHAGFIAAPPLRDGELVRITKAVQTAKMLALFHGADGLSPFLPGGSFLVEQASKVSDVQVK